MPTWAIVAALGLSHSALAKDRPRLPYPVIPTPQGVLRHGQPHLPTPIPADSRIAPRDFVPDEDGLVPLSPEQLTILADQERLARLSQNYRPAPAIWKFGDRDTTIYLFGTIHILPPGFAWRTPVLDRIVDRSSLLLLESVEAPGAPFMAPQGKPSRRLIDRVSPSHRAKLTAFFNSLPPGGAAAFDTMPTWIAAVAIGMVREMRSGEIPGPGADDTLEAQFRDVGKPVQAIEDSAQVMTKVATVPEADQRAMLNRALDAPDQSRAELRRSLHAWARGEIGSDSALAADIAASSRSSPLSTALLDDRNIGWTASLVQRLRRPGTILFAAGAGHFIGKGSVIDLLQQRGVKVTRIQ